MLRLVVSFRLGFLSDRVVEALCKYEKNDAEVSKKEKAILNEGVSLIGKVLNGRRQMSTGVYEKNALESIMIYNKSVSVVLDTPDLAREVNVEKIEEIFVDLKNSLAGMARGEKISTEKFERTKSFFNYLRKETLDDGTEIINGVYASRRSGKWELTLETLL